MPLTQTIRSHIIIIIIVIQNFGNGWEHFWRFSIHTNWISIIEWRSRAVWCSHSLLSIFFVGLPLAMVRFQCDSMSCEPLQVTFKTLYATENIRYLFSPTIAIPFYGFFFANAFHLISSNQMKQPDVWASNIFFQVYSHAVFFSHCFETTKYWRSNLEWNSYRSFSSSKNDCWIEPHCLEPASWQRMTSKVCVAVCVVRGCSCCTVRQLAVTVSTNWQ